MTDPSYIAPRDHTALQQLSHQLPHALLIVAEDGLDGQGAAAYLAASQPSDILQLSPESGKSSIGTEQIRDLIGLLRTQASRRRIITISPAGTMTEAAQNALLKSLEEPGAHTHFILVAETAEMILPTIRSRCQSLTLHHTTPQQDAALIANTTLPAVARQQILFLAAGRPRLIEHLRDNPSMLEAYQAVASDAKQIMAHPGSYQALQATLRHAADRSSALLLLSILLHFIRFQLQRGQATPALLSMMERAVKTEQQLRQNGHIKANLLALVV